MIQGRMIEERRKNISNVPQNKNIIKLIKNEFRIIYQNLIEKYSKNIEGNISIEQMQKLLDILKKINKLEDYNEKGQILKKLIV